MIIIYNFSTLLFHPLPLEECVPSVRCVALVPPRSPKKVNINGKIEN